MRTPFIVLAAVFSLTTTAALADAKIAYVDLKRAIGETQEGAQAQNRFKAELDKKKSDFEAEQNKLREEQAMLTKQSAMMSEEVKTQRFTEFQKRITDFAAKAEKLQVELAEKEQLELKKITDKMDPIISAIAQREGITVILDRNMLVWAQPSLDLTNEVVRTYNDRFPAKAGVPAKGTTVAKDAAKAPAPAPK